MLPEPLLPLVLVLALDAAAPEPCRLLIDGANGRYEVTAEITPPDVGQLTYAIEITVENGASRSRATNRGTVQVLEAGKSMALWQGVQACLRPKIFTLLPWSGNNTHQQPVWLKAMQQLPVVAPYGWKELSF